MSAGTSTQDNAERLLAGVSNPGGNAFLGNLRQIVETTRPARTNRDCPGGVLVDGALAATGVGCFVPVPVQVGDIISKIGVPIGATAGATMTHQFAALYAGTGTEPTLLAQSTDTTSAAIAEKKLASWTLASTVTITAANAPFGYVYAEIAITASTIPTAATVSTPAGVNYPWATNSPLFFAFTAGSALGATAAAKIESAAAKAVAPIVVLY